MGDVATPLTAAERAHLVEIAKGGDLVAVIRALDALPARRRRVPK
jgi:hypothetical protein